MKEILMLMYLLQFCNCFFGGGGKTNDSCAGCENLIKCHNKVGLCISSDLKDKNVKKYLSPTKENIGWLTLINSFLRHDVLNVINPKNVVKHIKVDEKAHYHTDVEKKCSMAQTRRPVLASHYIVNKINSNSGIFRTRSMHLCLWYAFL